jgi:hypothetical protein
VARGVNVKVLVEPALMFDALVGVPVTVNVTVLFALLRLSVPVAVLVLPDVS